MIAFHSAFSRQNKVEHHHICRQKTPLYELILLTMNFANIGSSSSLPDHDFHQARLVSFPLTFCLLAKRPRLGHMASTGARAGV